MNTHVQTNNDRSMHMTDVADRATRTTTTGENVTAIDKNTKTKVMAMTEVNVPFELVHAAAACASTDVT